MFLYSPQLHSPKILIEFGSIKGQTVEDRKSDIEQKRCILAQLTTFVLICMYNYCFFRNYEGICMILDILYLRATFSPTPVPFVLLREIRPFVPGPHCVIQPSLFLPYSVFALVCRVQNTLHFTLYNYIYIYGKQAVFFLHPVPVIPHYSNGIVLSTFQFRVHFFPLSKHLMHQQPFVSTQLICRMCNKCIRCISLK